MDKDGTRTASLGNISQDLLSTGTVVLTGGHDLAKSTLLTFPASAHAQLETWSSDRLLSVLRHYVTWVAITQRVHTVSCLADLQQASKVVITLIVEAVEKLELHARGTISTLYFLKPQVKSRSRLLKKLLGLKPSKKHPKIPLFKVILMKTYQDVFNQIDLCQLTPDFGGTLVYDHNAWMQFYKTVTPCIREGESVLRRVPDLRDRVELLQEYETAGQTSTAIQALLAELTDKYHHIISEVQFQEILDRCKQTLLTLDSTEASEQWIKRVHTGHVTRAADHVRKLYQELEARRLELEEAWKRVEENLMGHLQIQRHRERAVEIERRIKSHYEPLMQEHPCVGNTLSQAELYRTHFTTSLYEPAKELLSRATEILQHVHRLTERTQPPCDVTDIVQRLTVALQPFTHRLQSLQDVYVAVHIFHLLFQKGMSWYRKVLKFLPDSLQDRVTESVSAGTKIMTMPVEWQQTVQGFLAKHPPPREQHIARLDTEIPSQVEKPLRLQARALALRLRLLQRLLFSRRLSVKLLAAIYRWRNEVCNSNQSSAAPGRERSSSKSAVEDANTKNPSSPTKPDRLAAMARSVSYSSSDTGELEFSNRPFLSASGFMVRDSPEENSYIQGPDSDKMSEVRSGDGVMEYQKPPKLDIKILHPKASGDRRDNRHKDATKSETEHTVEEEQRFQDTENSEAERFIRLTFSPKEAPFHEQHVFNFDDSFEDEDLVAHFRENQAGSESGIEVAEIEDPWDNVIDKIKAVSNSNLPPEVKIQCMSHLLSRSAIPDGQLPRHHAHRAGQNHARRHVRHQDVLHFSDDGRLVAEKYQAPWNKPNEYHPRSRRAVPYDSDGQRGPHEDRWRDIVSDGFAPETRYEQRRFAARSGEKPAHTVARLRHRLAQSLWDLDTADRQDCEIRNMSGGWSSTTNLVAPPKPARQFQNTQPDSGRLMKEANDSFKNQPGSSEDSFTIRPLSNRDPVMHRSYEDGLNSPLYENSMYGDTNSALSRSYEDGLDSLHVQKRQKQGANKMVAWKSHGDGLNINPGLGYNDGPQNRQFGKYYESGLDSGTQPRQPKYENLSRESAQKNPYRWRQNITGEYPPSAPKSHHQSRDFIAPSFLRPYSSMTTINLVGGNGEVDAEYSGQKYTEEEVKPEGELEAGSMSGSDTTSCGAGGRLGVPDTNFDRLSDEVEQEYLSQDEVESSLKRSQRILMEAEEKLKERAKRTSSGPDNHHNSEQNHKHKTDDDIHGSEPEDLALSHKAGKSDARQAAKSDGKCRRQYEPIEIKVDEANDSDWEQADSYSASPEGYSVASSSLLAADCEWDADVSTISDGISETRAREVTKL